MFRPMLLVAAIACGCAGDATLVVLRFDAEATGADRAAAMHLRVCDEDNRIALDGRYELGADLEWPFRVELTPRNGDPARRFYAIAETLDGSGAPLERKLVVSSYTAGEERVEEVLFDGACIATPACGVGLTCEAGACADARRPPLAASGGPHVPPACSSLADTGCDGIAGVLFCDGFEGAAPLDGPWTERNDGGEVVVGGDAYRGSFAARASTPGPSESAKASAEGVLAGLSPAELHARAYFRVPRGSFEEVEVLRFEQIDPRHAIGVQVGRDFTLRVIERGASTRATPTPIAVAAGEWFCVSFSMTLADAGNATLRTTGAEFGLASIDTLPSAGYDRVSAGVVFASGGPAEVYVDEVAFGTSPIACED